MSGAALSPAFVLHRRRYRDTSLLLELFTQRQGRVVVIAKGAMSGRRSSAGQLQPFAPLLADWRGRGDIQTLTISEQAAPPIALKGKPLYCGFYLNELLVRLCHRNDPHIVLFASYGQALQSLSDGDDMDAVLRRFEMQLLHSLGLAPELARQAVSGEPLEPDRRYRLDPQAGVYTAAESDGQSIAGSTLMGLASGDDLSETGRREARRLLRAILAYHLGDRPLKSRELFQSLYADKA